MYRSRDKWAARSILFLFSIAYAGLPGAATLMALEQPSSWTRAAHGPLRGPGKGSWSGIEPRRDFAKKGVCEHEGASLYIRLDLEIRSQRDGQISTSRTALPRY